jgi:hypothetical protein
MSLIEVIKMQSEYLLTVKSLTQLPLEEQHAMYSSAFTVIAERIEASATIGIIPP